jgi:hypothetical protein
LILVDIDAQCWTYASHTLPLLLLLLLRLQVLHSVLYVILQVRTACCREALMPAACAFHVPAQPFKHVHAALAMLRESGFIIPISVYVVTVQCSRAIFATLLVANITCHVVAALL